MLVQRLTAVQVVFYIDPTGEYRFIRVVKGCSDDYAVLQVGRCIMYVPIESCALVDLTKPDLNIYPNTPKGTAIVAVRDTKTLLDVHIPKGTVLHLSARKRRYYKNMYHGVEEQCDLVTCDGMGRLMIPLEDFEIKV